VSSVAANVLRYGTGALNIDACRVAYDNDALDPATNPLYRKQAGYKNTNASDVGSASFSLKNGSGERNPVAAGRWPPNVALSHADGCVRVGTRRVRGAVAGTAGRHGFGTTLVAGEHKDGTQLGPMTYADADGMEEVEDWRCVEGCCAVAMLDAQSGERTSGELLTHHRRSGESAIGTFNIRDRTGEPCNFGGDTGGASRFFFVSRGEGAVFDGDLRFRYCAKADRAEREAGCEHLPAMTRGDVTGRDDDSVGQQHPRASVRRQGAIRNHHPTVKPVDLMRWLVRLITPPGGLVLDPFAGSGSTGVACSREGLRFIGVEREPEYVAVARARIEGDAPLLNRASNARPTGAAARGDLGPECATDATAPAGTGDAPQGQDGPPEQPGGPEPEIGGVELERAMERLREERARREEDRELRQKGW
jgi:hypothetical protein